jgi:hypothetical protein
MLRLRTNRGLLRRWLTLWLEDRRRARAATHVGPTVPNAPAGLVAVDWGTFIRLDWQDMSNNELGFRLYRKVDAGAYGLYQTLGANVTTYQDNSVVVMHQYYYYVTAYNALGESGPSNEVFLTFGA